MPILSSRGPIFILSYLQISGKKAHTLQGCDESLADIKNLKIPKHIMTYGIEIACVAPSWSSGGSQEHTDTNKSSEIEVENVAVNHPNRKTGKQHISITCRKRMYVENTDAPKWQHLG